MNDTSTYTPRFMRSQALDADALAAIHELAKQRAQTLRREAVSGLIDDAIAWVFHRDGAVRRATNARSDVACHS